MINPKIRFKKADGNDYQDYITKELWEVTSWDKSFNDVDKSKQPVKCSFKHVSAETLKNLKSEGAVTLLSTGQFQGTTSVEKANDYLNKGEVIALPSGGEAGVKYCNGLFVDSGNILATASRTHIADMKYLFEYLSKHINYIRSCYRGVSIKHPKMSDILDMQIHIPIDKEEQTKIANFLSEIDTLITSAESELEATKQLKKAMLQKMFPKKGEKVPEIRFPEFTDDWEQRKLGELFKERSERANGDEELLSVTIGNGVIRQADSDKRNTASEDKSNYKIVRKGDVPYNSMRMWQGAVGNSEYDGIVSPAYTVLIPTDEANGKFFMELFKKESTLQIFQRWSQGLTSDTWNLKYPALSTIQFYIPSVDEQNKIADYFSRLDNLITLYQRKVDTYKKFKKAMMQKMFV